MGLVTAALAGLAGATLPQIASSDSLFSLYISTKVKVPTTRGWFFSFDNLADQLISTAVKKATIIPTARSNCSTFAPSKPKTENIAARLALLVELPS